VSILKGFFNRLRLGSGSSGAPSMAFKEEPGLGLYRKEAGVIGVSGGTLEAASHPFSDATAIVKGSVDATKQVRVEADGLTTGTTRVLTMADQNIDLTPGTGSFATGAEGDLAATAMQDLVNDATPQLGGNLDANGKTIDGRVVATDGTKLDGIEASADVTDATNVNAAGAVMESDYNAHTVLQATSDNTPVPITIAEQTVVGRITAGNIKGLTATELRTLINVESGATADQSNAEIKTAYEANADTNEFSDAEQTKLAGVEASADVTDTTNVTAAGAVMDSEILDEDNMASDSATKVASQQSIKAYVDAAMGGVVSPFVPQGLKLSHDTDTDHDVNVTAGQCRDATDAVNMILTSEITKQIDAAWAVGDDAGGMDTGSVTTDTNYYVWLIKRSDTDVEDVLFSTSATAPTMPTNYDYKRLIGMVHTDASSNIESFLHVGGDEFMYTASPIRDLSDATLSAGVFEVATLSCPANCIAEITLLMDDPNAGGVDWKIQVREADSAFLYNQGDFVLHWDSGTLSGANRMEEQVFVNVNGSSQVDYAGPNVSSSGKIEIRTRGFRMLTRSHP